MDEQKLDKTILQQEYLKNNSKIAFINNKLNNLQPIDDYENTVTRLQEILQLVVPSFIFIYIEYKLLRNAFLSNKNDSLFDQITFITFTSLYVTCILTFIIAAVYFLLNIDKLINKLFSLLYKKFLKRKYERYIKLKNELTKVQDKEKDIRKVYKNEFYIDILEDINRCNFLQVTTEHSKRNEIINHYFDNKPQDINLSIINKRNNDENYSPNETTKPSVAITGISSAHSKYQSKTYKTEEKEDPKKEKTLYNLDDLFSINENPKHLDLFAIRKNNNPTINKEDLTERHQTNQNLGLFGEEFVFKEERKKLLNSSNPKLAESVKHVSKEIGDGFGYDIESYDENGNKIYIEVKTTKLDADSDFFLTENEFIKLKESSNYYIYRVFNFNIDNKTGLYFKINGIKDFERYYIKRPISFRVSLKPHSKK
jgi:hypothetical protein